MHGLPEEFDAAVFAGAELETLTFASNAIHLQLSGGLSITAQRHIRYRVSSEAVLCDDVLPVAKSALMALLGRQVERAEVRSPGDLLLHIAGGGLLLVEDDSEMYESYTVAMGGKEIFV